MPIRVITRDIIFFLAERLNGPHLYFSIPPDGAEYLKNFSWGAC
jgi:hypothetical protein